MQEVITKSLHVCVCDECLTHPSGRTTQLHEEINQLVADLDEKSRRQFVGFCASQSGHGGITHLSEITGLSHPTIRRGQRELTSVPTDENSGHIRAVGGGRKPVEKKVRTCCRHFWR